MACMWWMVNISDPILTTKIKALRFAVRKSQISSSSIRNLYAGILSALAIANKVLSEIVLLIFGASTYPINVGLRSIISAGGWEAYKMLVFERGIVLLAVTLLASGSIGSITAQAGIRGIGRVLTIWRAR